MEKRSILQRFMEWTRLGRRGSRRMDAGSPGGNGRQSGNGRLEKAMASGASSPVAAELDESSCASAQMVVETDVCGGDLTETVDVRKLSTREETIHRIQEGFQDLSGILRSIDSNMQEQAGSSRNLDEKMESIPHLLEETRKGNRHQLTLGEQLTRSNSDSELRQKEALKNLRALPVALAAIQENEIASYKVLAEIRDNLSRRNGLEEEMAESFKTLEVTLKDVGKNTGEQAEQIQNLGKNQSAMVKDFSKSQVEAVENFQISQDLALKSFKKAQNDIVGAFQQSQARNRKKLITAVAVLAAIFGISLLAITGIVFNAVSDLSESHKSVARAAMGGQSHLRDEVHRMKEEHVKTVGQLKGLLKKSQGEMSILMSATNLELEKFGADHTALVAEKNREIARLKDAIRKADRE